MPIAILSLIVLSIFLAVLFAIQGIYWAMRVRAEDRASAIARRIRTQEEPESSSLFRLQVRDEAAERLGNMGLYLESLLVQAGRPMDLRRLLTLVLVFSLFGMILGVTITTGPMGLVGLLAGGFPIWSIKRKADTRANQLSEQLPGALDLLGRSLQAGHGISDAMRVVSEELPQPVAGEFGRTYEEHNLGRDFRDCLRNLTERNPYSFDLKIFAGSVLLQRETGGNLVEILYNISSTIRGRFIFKGKVRSLTAEARFSALILGGLPLFVAGAILTVRPLYLVPLTEDIIGQIFLGYGITSYLTGILVMRNLARIDV